MTSKPNCGEESNEGARRLKVTTTAVWIFIVLELVLTVLTGYALLAKARGVAPFSRTGSASLRNDNNACKTP